MPHQLRRAKKERQAVVVIQAPHAVAARRLQQIRLLQQPHCAHVGGKALQDDARGGRQAAQLGEQHEKDDDEKLMAGAVVDARLVAEGLGEVALKLQGRVGRKGRFERGQKVRNLDAELSVPRAKGLVAEAHGLMQRRDGPDQPLQLVHEGAELQHDGAGRVVGVVTYGLAHHRISTELDEV